MGYEGLSPRARAICEVTELMSRHDILERRSSKIPGYTVPTELVTDIQERYAQLTNEEQAAVVDLRADRDGPRWRHWLEKHLAANPLDATELFFLQQHFGGAATGISPYVYEHYGRFDRPWRMGHQW